MRKIVKAFKAGDPEKNDRGFQEVVIDIPGIGDFCSVTQDIIDGGVFLVFEYQPAAQHQRRHFVYVNDNQLFDDGGTHEYYYSGSFFNDKREFTHVYESIPQ